MEANGVVVLEGRASRDKVERALEELVSGRMAENSVRYGAATQLSRTPWDPEKEATVRELAEDSLVLEVAELLRPVHGAGSAHCVTNEVRLLVLQPGCEAGALHRDVTDTSQVPLERPLQWGLNTIWAASPFTLESGATRFVPGSHTGLLPQGSWHADHPEVDALASVANMSVGSLVLYYASTLHSSRENQESASRIGINFNYAYVDSQGQRPQGWGW